MTTDVAKSTPERISDAEYAVMDVLWDASPLTASDVADRVDPTRGWNASTVKTLLARLVAKGAVAHEEDGRRYLYRPAIARADHAASESRRLVERLFGGRLTPLVAHFAQSEGLTPDDIAEIEALLRELKQ